MTCKDVLLVIVPAFIIGIAIWRSGVAEQKSKGSKSTKQNRLRSAEAAGLSERAPETPEQSAERRHAEQMVWTKRTVCWLAIYTVITGGIALLGVCQWQAVRGQLDAMEADQRPWLRPANIIAGPLSITGNELSMSFTLQYANTGKSPALKIKGLFDILNGEGSVLREHDALCRRAEVASATAQNSSAIFPNETNDPLTYPFKKDVGNLTANLGGHNGPPNIFVAPVILGCIAYKGALSDNFYHTWFSYDVSVKNGEPGTFNIRPKDQTILGTDIWLHLSVGGRNNAD